MTDATPFRTAWAAAHRAVAVTWIVGTGLVFGGIWLLGELASDGGTPFGDLSRPPPERFRDAATIALASAAIAHAALLPGTWIGRRRASAVAEKETEGKGTGRKSAARQSDLARQSVAGDRGGGEDRSDDDGIPEKSRPDGHDGLVAWLAGTLIRLFGTVALVGCYRYQLSESGDRGFFLVSIVGWYLVLTAVEVWVLAKALPAQDRPLP